MFLVPFGLALSVLSQKTFFLAQLTDRLEFLFFFFAWGASSSMRHSSDSTGSCHKCAYLLLIRSDACVHSLREKDIGASVCHLTASLVCIGPVSKGVTAQSRGRPSRSQFFPLEGAKTCCLIFDAGLFVGSSQPRPGVTILGCLSRTSVCLAAVAHYSALCDIWKYPPRAGSRR